MQGLYAANGAMKIVCSSTFTVPTSSDYDVVAYGFLYTTNNEKVDELTLEGRVLDPENIMQKKSGVITNSTTVNFNYTVSSESQRCYFRAFICYKPKGASDDSLITDYSIVASGCYKELPLTS